MRKILGTVVMALGLMGSAHAQTCDSTVTDNASVLGSKIDDVRAAAAALTAQGADVRVVTVVNPGWASNLEKWRDDGVASCSSWRSGNGMKSNMVILAVAPATHKMAIFYGSEYRDVLDSSAGAIKSQFMGPAFKDKEWARGLTQGETQVANRIKAFNEAALHPEQKTTVVNNQATDLTGVATAFKWLFGLSFMGLAIWGIYWLITSDKKKKSSAGVAQQSAVQVSNQVADTINRMTNDYSERKALGEDVDAKQRAVSLVSESYAKLAGSETYNTTVKGLSATEYLTMEAAYDRLLDDLASIARDGSKPKTSTAPSGAANQRRPSSYVSGSRGSHVGVNRGPSPAPAPAPTPVVHNTYIDNSSYGGSSYIPIPVIVEEPYHAPYREPDPDPTPSYSGGSSSSWSSSNDDGGGSSSSFSDDSSSSSDSGGGSSSDF